MNKKNKVKEKKKFLVLVVLLLESKIVAPLEGRLWPGWRPDILVGLVLRLWPRAGSQEGGLLSNHTKEIRRTIYYLMKCCLS